MPGCVGTVHQLSFAWICRRLTVAVHLCGQPSQRCANVRASIIELHDVCESGYTKQRSEDRVNDPRRPVRSRSRYCRGARRRAAILIVSKWCACSDQESSRIKLLRNCDFKLTQENFSGASVVLRSWALGSALLRPNGNGVAECGCNSRSVGSIGYLSSSPETAEDRNVRFDPKQTSPQQKG